ncbi:MULTISPECIES: hypothetical protein [unclassified Rickettsia]
MAYPRGIVGWIPKTSLRATASVVAWLDKSSSMSFPRRRGVAAWLL